LIEIRKNINNKESMYEVDERRVRGTETQYQNMNVEELLNLLKDTKSLHDEADILHFLYETK
jgi:hypothetical protein